MTFALATPEQLDQIRNYLWFYPIDDQTPLQVLVDDTTHPWSIQVEGHVRLHKNMSQLPYVFTQVRGDFGATHRDLTTLVRFPRKVGRDLYLGGNQLTDLTGAPDQVGGSITLVDNPLSSLVGFPPLVGDRVRITWQRDLPLLRLIQAPMIVIWDAPDAVEDILNKYAGKGKALMLNCAMELKKAGYVGNARW